MDERENELQEDMTLLEYLKRRLRGDRPEILDAQAGEAVSKVPLVSTQRPIFFFLAAIFILLGQFILEFFKETFRTPAIVFYLISVLAFMLAKEKVNWMDCPFGRKMVFLIDSSRKLRSPSAGTGWYWRSCSL